MTFARPSLEDLVTRVRNDITSRLGIDGAAIARRAMAKVLADVFAGAVHELHGHLVFLSRQLIPDTAEREYLVRFAALHSLTVNPAAFAAGTTAATGTNGTVIPTGTILVRDDNVQYQTTSEETISAGTASLPVTAVLAGVEANLDTGETLTVETPIAGLDSETTVEAPGITGGTNEETTEAFRARYLERLRDPLQGGNEQDYVAWAKTVSGVTRVWVQEELGEVTVWFVRDDETPILPDSGEISAVQTAIDAERPITADVTVVAPTELAVAFTIEVTPDENTTLATAQTNVEKELDDMFFRDGAPGDGVSRGTILLSAMQVAIGTATGVADFTLTTPSADVVPASGELAVRGTVTWV